ncbi:MAG: anti-sigma factor family protein, partial [Planctomycetota bacterium]
MSCSFEKEVLLLQDNEIPFARRMVVEAHLGVCDSCARLEQTVDAISEALASGPEAPLGVIAPALDRLGARRTQPLRKFALAAALMAAGFLLVFFVPRPDAPGGRPAYDPPPRSTIVELPPPRAPEGPPLIETVAAMDPASVEA